jgi:putative phosphotransacetylase
LDEQTLKRIITLAAIKQLALAGERYIPAAVSARHVHLCAADIEALFGKGHSLVKMRDLMQPGQYACEEQVTLVGKKGRIEKIRVLGPARRETQIEISVTDCYKAGFEPVVRMSGDLENTPGGTLIGPAGEVTLPKGVIVAARHLHATVEQAGWYGLKNGDIICVKKQGVRETVFGNVVVRTGPDHDLELHLDPDEANAAGIKSGDMLELVRG